MKSFFSFVFSSGALVIVALTAALLEPVWAADLYLNGWTLENLLLPEQRKLLAAQRNIEELDRLITGIKQVYEERMRAAQRLYDGRATLLETASVFRRLDRNRNAVLGRWSPDLTSHLDDEQVCYEVIKWMATYVYDVLNEKDSAQFIARLEEELQKHKERYGVVTLPGEGAKAP